MMFPVHFFNEPGKLLMSKNCHSIIMILYYAKHTIIIILSTRNVIDMIEYTQKTTSYTLYTSMCNEAEL